MVGLVQLVDFHSSGTSSTPSNSAKIPAPFQSRAFAFACFLDSHHSDWGEVEPQNTLNYISLIIKEVLFF